MSQRTLKTRGDVEAEIRQALIQFEKKVMGRGPLETRTYLLDDMVMVRLEGVLTPSEIHLAQSGDGRRLLKQVRSELLEKGRPLLEAVIQDILGIAVLSVHTDISTRTGERIIVFHLKEELPLEWRGTNTRCGLASRNGSGARDSKGVAQSS
jgi:uncharacterized protein YbcI